MPGEAEYDCGKVFLGIVATGTPAQFAGVERSDGLQTEVPLAHENCAGDHALDRTQESQGTLLKLEDGSVPIQGDIVETKSTAEPKRAQLPVYGVRIGKGEAFRRDRDALLLPCDPEREFELDRSFEINGIDQRLETIPGRLEGILSRFQIRGHEPAEAVGKKDKRLRQIAARDFDPGLDNDGARGIFDGSENRRRVQPRGTRQPEPG